MTSITTILKATDPATLIGAWTLVSAVLSIVNKTVIRGSFPKIANVIASICAVSPGDIATLYDEVVALAKGQPLSTVVTPVTPITPPASSTTPTKPAA